MRTRVSMTGWTLSLVLCVATFAGAQSYRFGIPEADVTVVLNPDGAADIHYRLQFTCARGAHSIDIVDIGMPNMGPHTAVEAAIDGRSLPPGDIRVSTYLKPKGCGYEVHLGSGTIQPGERGTFEFTGREEDMVWQDTTDPDQASFRFSPTWFGSQYVMGETRLNVRVILPIPAEDFPACEDRILWHRKGQDFSAKGVAEGESRVSVMWTRNVRLTTRHDFGLSFPKQYMTSVRKDSVWGVTVRWFSENDEAQVVSGIALTILVAIGFLRATNGTGCIVLLVVLVGLIVCMVLSPAVHLALYPILFVLAIAAFLYKRFRKPHYFSAKVCREGGGICRGLSSVEAAVLLEKPLETILTMVIFDLVRRGIAEIVDSDPLRVRILGKPCSHGVWLLPDGKKIALHHYERAGHSFLNELRRQQDIPVERMDLSKAFSSLVKRVSRAMKGRDLSLSRGYYESIVKRAWLHAQAERVPEVRMKRLDKTWNWLVMDPDWEREYSDLPGTRGYVPHWWRRGYCQPGHSGISAKSVPTPHEVPSTTFSDVFTSVTGRLKTACRDVAHSLDTADSNKGIIDLSAVDDFTQSLIPDVGTQSGGGGGGGFGGGGCACACAGCACACACAGGGR